MPLKLELERGVPFTKITVTYRGQTVTVPRVIVDTGSVATVLSTAVAARVGIVPEAADTVRAMRGIGGVETVFEREIDALQVGERTV